jgi:HK97 family phage portal protein
MRVFDATRDKIGEWAVKAAQYLSPVRGYGSTFGSWLGTVREPFTGAWQKNVECETPQNILAFSAVYACVSLIADDIAKLRIKLVEQQGDSTWQEVARNPAFGPFLRKPNRFQTRIQFLSQWIVCKLLQGNTYVLKERDQRRIVVAGYILDPRRVTPLVASDGDVFYELKQDALSGLQEPITVPASEIIHDRMITPWHPLIGVTPIYACGASATQGIRIQANAAKFFENMSKPSGILIAPGPIDDPMAQKVKRQWEEGSGGLNYGRVAVLSNGMKYEPMTINSTDSQLIEQLRFTVEDVARVFHVPLYKLGGPMPTFNNGAALNQEYYTQTLQTHIEAIELLLDEALGLGESPNASLGVELDLDGLLRMDPLSRAEVAVKMQILETVNEGRLRENKGPTEGGDAVFRQEQEHSLAALAKRDAGPDPFGKAAKPSAPALSAPEPTPAKASQEPTAKELADEIIANAARRTPINV